VSCTGGDCSIQCATDSSPRDFSGSESCD
jgi:hypothetical protein